MKLTITSLTNPKIKWVKSLQKNSTRKEQGVFVVEGIKEVRYALDNMYKIHTIFICPDIYDGLTLFGDDVEVYEISRDCFEKIAYRESSDGIIAIFYSRESSLSSVNMSDNPFFIVVESVEKPGNLGAIIRTADGVGADGVIVCDEKVDIYNPNVIRSSVGTIFTCQVISASTEEVLKFLKDNQIASYGAILSDTSTIYSDVNFTKPTAIILGNEHDGLSNVWKKSVEAIQIPMLGKNDSLNVSNACSVLVYEVVRQRNLVRE